MQEAQQSEGLDLLKNTPGRRRAISADSGALTQFSKTEDLGMPANVNLRTALDQGAGKFTLASSSTKTQSLELGAVKLWVPVLENVPMLVAAPVEGLNHHA
jgi:hypothetical protein